MEESDSRVSGSPRTVRLLTAVLLVATFAAGTLTGAGVCRWVASETPAPPPPFLPPVPLEELDLTPQQWEAIRQIVDRRRPELDAVLEETYPKVRKINEEIEREVREVLTPEQRKKFDELQARRPPPPRHGGPPGPRGPHGRPSHWGPPPPPPNGSFGPPPGPPFPAPPASSTESDHTR